MAIFKFDKDGKFDDKDIGHYEDSGVEEVREYVRKCWRDILWRTFENDRHYENSGYCFCPACGGDPCVCELYRALKSCADKYSVSSPSSPPNKTIALGSIKCTCPSQANTKDLLLPKDTACPMGNTLIRFGVNDISVPICHIVPCPYNHACNNAKALVCQTCKMSPCLCSNQTHCGKPSGSCTSCRGCSAVCLSCGTSPCTCSHTPVPTSPSSSGCRPPCNCPTGKSCARCASPKPKCGQHNCSSCSNPHGLVLDDLIGDGLEDFPKEPKNNDGRSECYWCSAPTRKAGMGTYDVCTKCGR